MWHWKNLSDGQWREIFCRVLVLTLHWDGENTAPAPPCSGRRWCPCPAGWLVPAAAEREIDISTMMPTYISELLVKPLERKPSTMHIPQDRHSSQPTANWAALFRCSPLGCGSESGKRWSWDTDTSQVRQQPQLHSLCSQCPDSATHVVPDCSPNRS